MHKNNDSLFGFTKVDFSQKLLLKTTQNCACLAVISCCAEDVICIALRECGTSQRWAGWRDDGITNILRNVEGRSVFEDNCEMKIKPENAMNVNKQRNNVKDVLKNMPRAASPEVKIKKNL